MAKAKALLDGSIELSSGRQVYADDPVLVGDLRELVPLLVPAPGVFPGAFRGGGGFPSGGGSALGGGPKGPAGPSGPPGPSILFIGESITGSSAGGVLFVGAGNDLQEDPTAFFWDIANLRLGINTNVPARRVEIVDAADPQLRLSQSPGVFTDLHAKPDGSLGVTPTMGMMSLEGPSPVFTLTGNATDQALTLNFVDNAFASLKGSVLYAGNNVPGSKYIGIVNFSSDFIFVGTLNPTPILFTTNGLPAFTIDPDGNFYTERPQSAAMTSGFILIPGGAGPPTGIPTSIVGYPVYWDFLNRQIFVYSTGWKASPVFT